MRFQQLKHDPNTIERKRLVKSKKNWVVLSSLSIAGGLFLLSAPSVLVKADTTSNQTQTVLTAKAPSAETSSVTDNVVNASKNSTNNTDDKTVNQPVVAKADVPTTGTDTAAQTSGTVEPQVSTPESNTDTTGNTQLSTVKSGTTEDTQNLSTDVPNTAAQETSLTQKTLTANLAASNIKLASLGITPELLSITPETATLPDGNIAESTQGTTPWYITAEGVLHFGTASSTTTFADNTATTTGKTSESTDKTSTSGSTSTSTTGSTTTEEKTPTSPWATNADSINTIIFDGKVTAATDMNHMFANLYNLKSIENIDNLDVSNTENTSGMFANDTNLVDATNSDETHTADNQKLNLSSLNWFTVKDSSDMFLNDSSVTEIVLPTDTYATFAQSSNDTYMFKNDINLKTVNLDNWQFRVPKKLTGMFQNDISLDKLDLSTWNMIRQPISGPLILSETGDSSKGQGMFDGTNLSSITLSLYNRFNSYTDLPSKKSNHWYDSGNNVKFSTMAANDSGNTLGTLFATGTVPQIKKINLAPNPGEKVTEVNAIMSIPSNLGNQDVHVTGTLNSAVINVGVPEITGYKPNISSVNGTIISSTTATTNYYVTYVGDPVGQWTASVALPDKSTKEITGTKNSAGEEARVGDKVTFDAPTVEGYTVSPATITGTIKDDGTVKFTDPTYSQKKYTNTVTIKSNLPDKTIEVTEPVGPVKIDVPEVIGYTSNPTKITGTINSDGTLTLDPDQTVTYTGNTVANAFATIETTQNGKPSDPVTIKGISGKVGDTVDVQVPIKDGYTSPETVKGVIQDDGKTVLVKDPIQYVGESATSSATISTNLGDKTVDNISGTVGESITIPVPDVKGYKADKSTVTGTVNPDKTITVDSTQNVTYTGNPVVNASATIETTQNGKSSDSIIVNGISGKVGDIVDVQVPTKDGYTSPATVKGVIQDDGKTVLVNDTVAYVGKSVTSSATIKSNIGNQTVDNIDGTVGESVTIPVPEVKGYKADKSTVIGIVNPDKTITLGSDQIVTYSGNTVNNVTVSFKDANGNTVNAIISSATVGSTVQVTPPTVKGYTPSPSAPITGTINNNGEFVPDPNGTKPSDVIYTGNPVNDVTVHFKDANGNTVNATISSTTVGSTVQVTPPTIKGYTPSSSAPITGTIDNNGEFVPDPKGTKPSDITYTGNTVNNITVPFKDANGNTVNAIISNPVVGSKVTVTVPTVTGYTPSQSTITGTINTDGEFVPDPKGTKPSDVKYTGNTVKDITVPFTDSNGNTVNATISKPVVGSKVIVTVPTVTGYTPSQSTVTGTINTDGEFVPDPEGTKPSDIKYIGNTVKDITVPFTDANGNTVNATISKPVVGSKVIVTVPTVTGYTPSKSTVTGTINDKGEFVSDPGSTNMPNNITYTGNTVSNASATIKTTQNGTASTDIVVNSISGKVGDTVDIPVESKPGYTTNVKTVKGVIQADGKTVSVSDVVRYVGVPYTDAPATIKSNLGNQHVDHISGKVGDTITVNVPVVKGYTADKNTVTGVMGTDGSVTSTDVVTYKPDTITTGTVVISTPKGDKTVSDLTGTVDDKGNVTIKVPDVQGYTPNKPTITGTMSPNGTVVPSEKVTYTPNNITTGTTIISTPDGAKKVTGLTGTVDNENGVTIKVPDIQGYTPDKPTITGTMDPDGTVTPTEPITYTPNKITTGTTTISTSKGNKQISGLTGVVDAKDGVTIKVPDVQGFTPDKPTITGTMNPDGTVTPNEKVTYTPNNITTGTTTISTPDGDKELTDLTGTVDNENGVTIKVPDIQGYTPDKPTITGTMNPDGTVTPNEKVTYTGNPVNNQSLNIPATKDSKDSIQTVTGLNGKVGDTIEVPVPTISGYTANIKTVKAVINPDGSITTTDKVIYTSIPSVNNNSDKATLEMKDQTISTYADKPDVQVYGLDSGNTMTPINDRILPHQTNWKSDAVITIDGTSYYRVATNEFVKFSQAYPYRALNLYIRTYHDSEKPLYRAEEDLIGNKTLAPSSSWITDREAYFINGEKYYRVATNEFVKASDVYVYSPVQMTVAAHSDSVKHIYDDRGQLVENHDIKANSNWKADSITYINGDKFYRVATNEFVKADDVYVYTPSKIVVTTHSDSAKNIYNDKGQLVKNRDLKSNSDWLVDGITYMNGEKYYRVASDEFVKASDVDINH